jgi:hypothetical protein
MLQIKLACLLSASTILDILADYWLVVESPGPGAASGYGFFAACAIIAGVIERPTEPYNTELLSRCRDQIGQLWYLPLYSVGDLFTPSRAVTSTTSSAVARIGRSCESHDMVSPYRILT